MAIGCGAKFSKILLIVFNIFFFLSGIALIALGIYVMVSKDLKYLDEWLVAGDPILKKAGGAAIGVGCFIMIMGFLGCCGALKESKCMLIIYVAALVIVMGAELGIGIWIAVKKNYFQKEAEKLLLKNLNKYPAATDAKSNLKNAVDYFQKKVKCCGVRNYTDWADTEWGKAAAGRSPPEVTPASCCPDPDKYPDCQSAKKYYKDGCWDTVEKKLKGTWYIYTIPIVVGVIELLGIICGICLCTSLGDSSYNY